MSFLIASSPETKEIAKKVARLLNGQYSEISAEKFPDNESKIKLNKNPKNKIFVLISSLAKEPNKKIIESILAAGIAKDYGAKKTVLIATYLPYMRQDAHFENYDSFSSKYILQLFSNFNKVIAIDPHLHRIKTLKQIAKNASETTSVKLIADYIKNNFKNDFTILGPDKESQQWGKRIAKILHKRAVILKKQRFSAEKVKIQEKKFSGNVIIIDDIISTGHTILETIKIAKSHNAEKITCIGIHALLIGNSAKLITKHAKLITTNTIQNKYSKIDISPIIAEALKKYK